MIPEANELLDRFNLSASIKAATQPTQSYNYSFYSNLIKYSQYIYLLSLHFPERLDKLTHELSVSIAKSINTGYNTIASSYAIMGSLAYSNTINSIGGNSFKLQQYSTQAVKGQELSLKAARITTTELDVMTNKLQVISTAPNFFYQLLIAGFDKQVGKTIEENGIELDRQYLDDEGQTVTSVKLGSTLNVLLTIRSVSNDTVPNIAVVDLLPGGFEVDSTTNIKTKLPASWEPYYVDKRDDRVVIFGSVPDYKVQYQYKIKAVNKGTFTIPPCYGESMYIPSIYSKGIIGSIVVE